MAPRGRSRTSSPRFDPEALRDRAGDRAFARGEAYYRGGQVAILALDTGRVLAQVAGTDDYRTELTGGGARIGGACSCPAFEDRGFCKHLVAVALAANAAGEGTDVGALGRIRDHLESKDVGTLAAMILDLAERDPALFRRLEIAAAVQGADDGNVETRLRKAIAQATRTRGFVDYRAARDWADGVETALEGVAGLVPGRARLAAGLAYEAIAAIERAAENIDDSDGHCGALLLRARDIHLAACLAEPPDPVALARDLFAREMADPYATFYAAAALYADALGEAGLAEYRRLATEAWDALPPPRRGEPDLAADHGRLARILDFFAERDGDLEARIAIRARRLLAPWDYLRLAEFCLEHGREAAALRHAEDGLWIFEDKPTDERLLAFAERLLVNAGRARDAEAHLWRAFDKAPSLALYERLRALGGTPARDRALARLERLAAGEPGPWHAPADLLVRVLVEEAMLDAAWKTVRARKISLNVREALARASEATHAEAALAVYAERVEQLAKVGGDLAYAEAVALVARMADLRDNAAHTVYVADLKRRFGRKRNLMRLLG